MNQASSTKNYNLKFLADYLGAKLSCINEALPIENLSSFKNANKFSLCLFHQKKYLNDLLSSACEAFLIPPHLVDMVPKDKNLIIHESPYKAFALLSKLFKPESAQHDFRAPTAFVADSAKIGKNCYIAHGAYIGENVIIGDDCKIGVHSFIDNNVTIGNDCCIENQVSISNARLGNFVTIHPGARIGQEGFGFASDSEGHYTIHHQGQVIIGNHVSIGANTCIDRGTLDNTEIDDHVRLDNLIQIGHNVKIGKGTIMAAQVGIAGSTKIGKHVTLGGQVGVIGHLRVKDNAYICMKSFVTKNVPENARLAGSPAIKDTDWHRQTIHLKKLIKK